jgi:hypothetical protein
LATIRRHRCSTIEQRALLVGARRERSGVRRPLARRLQGTTHRRSLTEAKNLTTTMPATTVVTTAADLLAATQSPATDIEVRGTLTGMPMITLQPGVRLHGGTLIFGARGLRLTRDNELDGVTIMTADHEVAILNDTSMEDLGTLTLRDVRTAGQVLLRAQDAIRSGHVKVERLTVERADLRGRLRRPHGFNVDAMQGAFTLWNRQDDPGVTITAELLDIAAGSAEAPVRGSGVFVGGHGNLRGIPDGGTVKVSVLRTGEIHTDGGIRAGTPDLISGGVFVLPGAIVDQVLNAGPVTTYGPNDMVLDNWGEVRLWTATAPVTSHGPSGIGFVNFAPIDRLDVQAPIQTFGAGARGFNLYDGSLRHASFKSIATHADGAIGVQVSKPLPILEIAGDLTTEGGQGLSLVKGVQVQLKAMALSVKSDGKIGSLHIGGKIQTAGDDVVSAEIAGEVDQIKVDGGIHATGKHSDAVHLREGSPALLGIAITAVDGQDVVRVAE